MLNSLSNVSHHLIFQESDYCSLTRVSYCSLFTVRFLSPQVVEKASVFDPANKSAVLILTRD